MDQNTDISIIEHNEKGIEGAHVQSLGYRLNIYIYIYIYINKILGIDDHCISPKKTRGVCDLSLPLIYKILQKPQSSHRAVLDCETNKQKKKRNILNHCETCFEE